MAKLSEMGIQVVEGEERPRTATPPGRAGRKSRGRGEATGNVDEELGRTDDPVRMYLREMGSVELLSREGEIAIAKRIEAGRDMMIGGLCESPLTFKAIISWHDQLKAGRMLLRDIIDLEATQGGAAGEAAQRPAAPVAPPSPAGDARARAPRGAAGNGAAVPGEADAEDGEEDDGPRMSLSALEEKLKPEVLANFEEIEALYKKLHKMQHRRLETMTRGEEEQRVREELREAARGARRAGAPVHNNRIEELARSSSSSTSG